MSDNTIQNMYPLFSELTADQYNDCVKYFLDTEVNHIIFNLSDREKDQFFTMITDYSALLDTLFFVKGAPFTNYVLYGNEFYEALQDPHPGIDFTPSWIVAEYKRWLEKNDRPFPEDLAVKHNFDLTPMLEFQANLAAQ